MSASLEQIVAATRRRLSETGRGSNARELERLAQEHTPRGFGRALKSSSASQPAVIAELKKASPSRGLIRANFNPATLASELETAGAAALSVLTDEDFFQGSLQNLSMASAATGLPCLRKDFIVAESQIVEARAHRADAVLLIVAVLSQQELITLSQCARAMELDVLCEVHDQEELQRALDAGFDIIGVNSRDLRTFQVDINTALGLGEKIPKGVVAVAESGIHSGSDVAKLRAAGYGAFLIGESLMSAPSPGEALVTLIKDAMTEIVAGVHP
jgi:indole-3-glycerol phosphate synthase